MIFALDAYSQTKKNFFPTLYIEKNNKSARKNSPWRWERRRRFGPVVTQGFNAPIYPGKIRARRWERGKMLKLKILSFEKSRFFSNIFFCCRAVALQCFEEL
jgi:hypothetical protein